MYSHQLMVRAAADLILSSAQPRPYSPVRHRHLHSSPLATFRPCVRLNVLELPDAISWRHEEREVGSRQTNFHANKQAPRTDFATLYCGAAYRISGMRCSNDPTHGALALLHSMETQERIDERTQPHVRSFFRRFSLHADSNFLRSESRRIRHD